MIRRYNYTNRARITRDAITIRLREGTPPAFDADLRLAPLRLNGEARIVVEAYRDRSLRRFEFGTIAVPVPPADRSLEGFIGDLPPLFRVKVVDDSGRLLALAERVQPVEADGASGRIPILPLVSRDLGERVWNVSFEDGAVLEVNSRIPGIDDIARSDSTFRALVYPAAARMVLTRMAFVDQYIDSADGEWHDWVRFAERWFALPYPDPQEANENERNDWIEGAVSAFSASLHAATLYESAFAK